MAREPNKTMKKLLFFLLGATFSTSLMAQNIQRSEAARMVQEGDNMVQSGLLESAYFSYTNAITTDHGYADAYMKRSVLLQKLGRTTEARNDYETAMRLNPYSSFHLDQQAKLNFILERYDAGLQSLDHALAMEPDNHQLREHRTDGYILKGEYEAARRDLELLRETGLNQPLITLKQALIYFLVNDMDNAEVWTDRALDENPESALALDLKGLMALTAERYEEALQWFERAIAADKHFPLAYYNAGVACRMLHREKRALEYFDLAVATNLNEAQVYFARALLRTNLGDFQGAIDDLTQMNTEDTIYFNALYHRAFAFKMIGDFESALIDANQAIELNPTDAHAWLIRGNAYMLFSDYHEAIIDYTQALQLDPLLAEAAFNRGLCKLLSQRLKEGCTDLELSKNLGHAEADEAMGNFCRP